MCWQEDIFQIGTVSKEFLGLMRWPMALSTFTSPKSAFSWAACERGRTTKEEEVRAVDDGRPTGKDVQNSMGKLNLISVHIFIRSLLMCYLSPDLVYHVPQASCWDRSTEIAKRVLPRLREGSWQVEAEVVSNSSNKIHQTLEALFWPLMYEPKRHLSSLACKNPPKRVVDSLQDPAKVQLI